MSRMKWAKRRVGDPRRPVTLHMEFDEQGRPKAAEIRGNHKALWAWPEGYKSHLPKIEKKALEHYSLARKLKREIENQGWDHRVQGQQVV